MSSPVIPANSPSAGHSWNALADQVLAGDPLTQDQAMSVLSAPDDDL